MTIDDCRRALPSLAVAAALAGCVFSVPEPALVREPRPEPVPLRMGVYYPPELRSFTYRHHLTDTAWILGKPSVRLLGDALSLLFADVVEVPRPGTGPSPGADVAGVIEPRLVSASAVYWSDEHVKARRAGPTRSRHLRVHAVHHRRGARDVVGSHGTGRGAGRKPTWRRPDAQAQLRARHARGRVELHARVPRRPGGASLARGARCPRVTRSAMEAAQQGPGDPALAAPPTVTASRRPVHCPFSKIHRSRLIRINSVGSLSESYAP